MFTNISWSSYITFMIIVSAVYYLVIGFQFYRSDVLKVISGTKPASVPVLSSHQAGLKEAFENQDIFRLAQSLADEVQAYLKEAGRNKISKQDVVQSLKSLPARYPAIKDSSFKDMIQNLMITECETNCSIHLSEQELSEIWG